MQHQGRGMDILRVLQGRRIPILLEVVEQKTLEIVRVTISAVPSPIVADEIRNGSQGHRGLEPVGMSHDPVRHESAVAAAGHSHSVRVNPIISFEDGIYAGHNVLVIHAAPVVDNPTFELLSVAGRSSRVTKKDGPTPRRIHLELVIPVDSVLSGRPPMHTQNQRIFLPRSPPKWLYQE